MIAALTERWVFAFKEGEDKGMIKALVTEKFIGIYSSAPYKLIIVIHES